MDTNPLLLPAVANFLLLRDTALNSIDIHFAGLMCKIAKNNDPLLFTAAALASNAVYNGHACLDFSSLNEPKDCLNDQSAPFEGFPDPQTWADKLLTTPVVGVPGEFKPLIIDTAKLYLYKYWRYEQICASQIINRIKIPPQTYDPFRFSGLLLKYFPSPDPSVMDSQKIAVHASMLRSFTVISGGPGTGKTTTVAKIVALFLELTNLTNARIALTAPTGKAAARLQQALRDSFSKLPVSQRVKQRVDHLEASTLHRFLGIPGRRFHFDRFDADFFSYDLVIVDEASMIDIALMAKLLSSVPVASKIVLLGDKNQLASVEAGAVLSDICAGIGEINDHTQPSEAARSTESASIVEERQESGVRTDPSLVKSIVQLTTHFRFSENAGIGRLCSAIKRGNAQDALHIIDSKGYPDISRRDLPSPVSMFEALSAVVVERYRGIAKEHDPRALLDLFDSFRVLCAVRRGPYGVEALNGLIERILAAEKMLRPSSPWYAGRPVMITRNDYTTGLFNGDIGVFMEEPSGSGECKVYFPGEGARKVRSFPPQRLPEHETVFAMTVHKAQGSEFGNVLLIVPPRYSSLLSRELLYTGITRAKISCTLWSDREILFTAIKNTTSRMSGLREKLWGTSE